MKSYISNQKNLYGEYNAQIDFDNTQVQIISNSKKVLKATIRRCKKIIRNPVLEHARMTTYYAIQHKSPKMLSWSFSNYDSIAWAASSLNLPAEAERFTWVYGTKTGAVTLRQAKKGLQRVIDDNKNGENKDYIFRIVKVVHFDDLTFTEF